MTFLLNKGDIGAYTGSAKQGWFSSLKELRSHINTVHLAYSNAILVNVVWKHPDQLDNHFQDHKNIVVYSVEAARY